MTESANTTPIDTIACCSPSAVVALGASAGGLEAFREFFSHTPSDSGLSFVIVHHQDPNNPNLVPELLSSHTALPVHEAKDGIRLEPNSVYVIPPSALLGLEQGRLRVTPTPSSALRNSINSFFRALAEDQGHSAVAIVLSGIGSDGALGLKAVKAHGGLTLAQSPESARYDAMPRRAVMTGLVDHVLPAHAMPAKLIEYATHLQSLRAGPRLLDGELDGRLEELLGAIRDDTGHDFRQYKRATLLRRIQRRLQVEQLSSIDAYLKLLRTDPSRRDQLVRDLLVGVTEFFRDAEAFEALATLVLQPLVAKGPPEIRIWVPGCATGEEAYSIAILLAEACDATQQRPRAQIFATDLDERALEHARAGRYGASIEPAVGAERLARFFSREGEEYAVGDRIRGMCIFSQHDLLRDPPFSRLDLVSCKNLLIYFQPDLQQRVLDLFHYALADGGHLVLGPSESVSSRAELFVALDKRFKIFARKPAFLHTRPDFFGEQLGRALRKTGEALRHPGAGEQVLARTLEAVLVEQFAPPAIVVNELGDVVYLLGKTGKFLEPPAGAMTAGAVNLVRRQIRPVVRAALQEAFRTRELVTHSGLRIDTTTGPELFELAVRPLSELPAAGLFAVVFRELGPLPTESASRQPETELERTVQQLKRELESSKHRLQTTIEELETSNEELRSTNEELLGMNEELQSLNEQFQTINLERKSKLQELDAANGDLDNLLRSTQIATLFLDSSLRIRRFTPALAGVFHVIDGDLGRPITDLAARFEPTLLPLDAREVLRTLTMIEREVVLENGDPYIMRTTPYRTLDNLIDGVVVTFVEIGMLKQAEESRARLAAIIEGASEAVIGKTLDGTIVSWNPAAESIYGYRAEEMLGKSIYTLIPPDRAAELEAIIERLRGGQRVPRFETERVRKDGGRVSVSLTISPIRDSAGSVIGASAISRDVTLERQAARALNASEQRYRSLVAATSAVVWTTDPSGAFGGEQQSWQGFTGQTPEQYRGWGWLQALHADDRVRVRDAWRIAVFERSIFETGFRIFSAAHATHRHVAARAVPVLDESGQAREWIGTLSDVTAEREAVETLRVRADELRAVIDGSAAGIVEADATGRILRSNRRFAEMTRFAPEELVGMRLAELSHPDDRDKNSVFLEHVIQQRLPGYSGERRLMKKNGEVFFAQLSASILRDASGAATRLIGVLQDMTERKLAETELARAKHAAEQASRAKDQFLAVLSHELRTPLTPVLAAVGKLEKTETLTPEGRDTLGMIQRNVELEARLIDDLLDLTRISRGRLSLRFEVADASSVMAQALEIVSNEVEEKSLRLEPLLEEGCLVKADTARLQQVFWNLLKNAVKFTPTGGMIRVRCRHDLEGRVVTEVSDTGIGIDRKLLPHVFEAFEQGEGQREGLGLGLAISRALVQLHGGALAAESAGTGRGATFRVALPATSEPASAGRRRPETPLEPSRNGLSILLVEDHADSALLMRELLELSGHEVVQAASLAEARAAAEGRVFDLLLSDLGLPDGSGLELVRALRESGSARHAIALSGYGMEDDVRRSREAGFEEHLVKPVNPRDLDETIRRITKKA
jgi:two-component system, chemotaxis family, CheB/CheR fusion protein